jgi:hypothetical protein
MLVMSWRQSLPYGAEVVTTDGSMLSIAVDEPLLSDARKQELLADAAGIERWPLTNDDIRNSFYRTYEIFKYSLEIHIPYESPLITLDADTNDILQVDWEGAFMSAYLKKMDGGHAFSCGERVSFPRGGGAKGLMRLLCERLIRAGVDIDDAEAKISKMAARYSRMKNDKQLMSKQRVRIEIRQRSVQERVAMVKLATQPSAGPKAPTGPGAVSSTDEPSTKRARTA